MSRYGADNAARKINFPAEQVLQEEQSQSLRALPGKRAGKAPKLAIPYGKYMMIMAGVFAVLLCVVSSYMRLSTLTTKNSELKKEISSLESDISALSAKKEQLYNLEFVEDYATNTLGMVKADKSQVSYLEMGNSDRMVLAGVSSDAADAGDGLLSRLLRSFNAVLEYLN